MGGFPTGMAQREAYEAANRAAEARYRAAREQNKWSGGTQSKPGTSAITGRRTRTVDRLAIAYRLLKIEGIATPDTIRAAFKSAVKAAHPDNGGSGADMDALKSARDLLLKNINQETTGAESNACVMCKGSGSVAAGFGSEPCTTCNGKGIINV